jgi:hypothetical protein
VSGRTSEINGADAPASFATSQPFSLFLPEGNIFQFFGFPVAAGTNSPGVSSGYWVLTTPLSPGDLTVTIRGIRNLPCGEFATRVDYTIHVQ